MHPTRQHTTDRRRGKAAVAASLTDHCCETPPSLRCLDINTGSFASLYEPLCVIFPVLGGCAYRDGSVHVREAPLGVPVYEDAAPGCSGPRRGVFLFLNSLAPIHGAARIAGFEKDLYFVRVDSQRGIRKRCRKGARMRHGRSSGQGTDRYF